jgi:hypothetical protein
VARRADQGGDLFRFAREYVKELPNECGVYLAGLSAPPEPFVPEEHHIAPVYAFVIVGLGDAETHAGLIEPVRQAVPPLIELVTPMPYTALQQMFNDSAPWGILAYEKAVYIDELSDGAIEVILEHQPKKTFPLSFLPIFVLGGVYSAIDEDATGFGGSRKHTYILNIAAAAPTPEIYEAEREWVRTFWSALAPHAPGVGSYVNFMTDPDEDRAPAAYGPGKYERLARIKAQYDPNNMFHSTPTSARRRRLPSGDHAMMPPTTPGERIAANAIARPPAGRTMPMATTRSPGCAMAGQLLRHVRDRLPAPCRAAPSSPRHSSDRILAV